MLPQVLAGLGAFSLLSAGCLFWLEQLAPLFFVVAVASLGYQVWMVRRMPQGSRTFWIKTILAVSLLLNILIIGGWIVLSIRYR